MRYRRRTRRKLTPREKRLREIEDRAQVRVQILTRGVSGIFERMYSSKDLALVLDFIMTDLKPAIKQHEQAEEACDNMRVKARATATTKKNPPTRKAK